MPAYQLALANTLLNMAGLLSPWSQADELEPLYRRILELDRAAVRTAPDDPEFNAELALALGDQGMFFLEAGRGSRGPGRCPRSRGGPPAGARRRATEGLCRTLRGAQLSSISEEFSPRRAERARRSSAFEKP